jgi:hypothetical protein
MKISLDLIRLREAGGGLSMLASALGPKTFHRRPEAVPQ